MAGRSAAMLIRGAERGTSHGALIALILYDLTILRRSAGAAFARKRDILLLLLVVPVALLLAIQRAAEAAAALGSLPIPVKMAMAAAAALAVNIAVGGRLVHLREESVIARQALRPCAALLHALFWNALPIAAIAGLLFVSPDPALLAGLLLLSYPAGVALAAGQRIARARIASLLARRREAAPPSRRAAGGVSRRERVIALLAARIGLFGRDVRANLLAFGATGAALGGAYAWLSAQLSMPAAAAIAGLPMLALLLVLLRARPALLRYLLYLGVEPLLPAFVATAIASALIGAFVAVALGVATAPLALLAGGATLLLLFLAMALLRTLHFATKPRQNAEIAMQVDLLAAALAGFVMLPLAPAILCARLWLLARRARAMRWLAQ